MIDSAKYANYVSVCFNCRMPTHTWYANSVVVVWINITYSLSYNQILPFIIVCFIRVSAHVRTEIQNGSDRGGNHLGHHYITTFSNLGTFSERKVMLE